MFPLSKEEASPEYETNTAYQIIMRLGKIPYVTGLRIRLPHRKKRVLRIDKRIRDTSIPSVMSTTKKIKLTNSKMHAEDLAQTYTLGGTQWRSPI